MSQPYLPFPVISGNLFPQFDSLNTLTTYQESNKESKGNVKISERVKFIDNMLEGLSITRQREYLEECISLFSSSSPDYLYAFYKECVCKLAEIYKSQGYSDRLEKVSKTFGANGRKRGGNKEDITSNFSSSSKFKQFINFFPNTNLERVLLSFSKEFLDDLANIIKSNFTKISIDKLATPLSSLGIIWFIPRLIRNTYLMLKHLIYNGNLDYVGQYFSDWLNDISWLMTNAISFGIGTHLFLSPWAVFLGPGGIYLSAVMGGIDILNTAVKSCLKINKINRILDNNNQKIIEYCTDLGIEYNYDLFALLNKVNELEKNSSDGEKLKKIISLKVLVNTQSRLQAKKDYVKHDLTIGIMLTCAISVGVALLAIPNPVTALVGSAIVLSSYAMYQYTKKKYLPKKEIQLSINPLEQLHLKLVEYVDETIERLSKKIKKGDSLPVLEKKLNEYKRIKEILKSSYNELEDDIFIDCMKDVMKVSKISRGLFEPTSYKELKSILKTFNTPWTNATYDSKIIGNYKNLINSFVNSSASPENSRFLFFSHGIKIQCLPLIPCRLSYAAP
ncbi:MAG: hypothetical protein EP298_03365 [Gammaproteobacteria bacterium]|nr:MAG: hypothetical protein EP298_03365 [Gammaproteobacteria bacterium]UTW43497.1 hypothetical protein KFE69_05235 [bacterium SCSIO 12844]